MNHPPHLKKLADGRLVLKRRQVRAYWRFFRGSLAFTDEEIATLLLDHALPADLRAAQQKEGHHDEQQHHPTH